MRRFRGAVLAGAGTLAIAAGLLGAVGSAVPANAAPAAAARPAAGPFSSSLSCTYTMPYHYSTGFVWEFTIANNGTTSVPFPTFTWTWPGSQEIIAAYGASITQSGPTVTVSASPAGLMITPGSSVGFGIVVNGTLPPAQTVPCTLVS